jgi:hypothetical protein
MRWRSTSWLALSLLSVGGLLLLLGLWFSWGEARFAAAAETVAGVVIETPAGGPDNPDQSYGRVAYQYRGERQVLALWPGSGSGTLPADAMAGDVQTLLVPPGEPARARVTDFDARYAPKIVLLSFGMILLMMGSVAWIAFRDSDDGSSTQKVGLAFLALGLVLLGAAGGMAWSYKSWSDRSIATIGVAISRDSRVRVRVTDRQRRIWHARASFLPSSLPPGRAYVTVPIRYHADRPWEIAPYGWRQYWSTPLFLGGFALAWCAVPLLGLWLERRARRQRSA